MFNKRVIIEEAVRIIKPADPEKLKAYRESLAKRTKVVPKKRLDKMGRKKPEKTGMSLETANYITDQRMARMLRNRFRHD